MAVHPAELVRQARKPLDGPEMELLSKALSNGLLRKRQLSRRVYCEPKMPTGYPDIVVAYASARRSGVTPARKRLTVDHLRLIHQLYHHRGCRIDTLATAIRLHKTKATKLVDDLVQAGVLWRRGDYVALRSMRDVFPVRHIVAVECKVNDWRRALRQAVANTWFASESFILIPDTSSLATVEAECREAGIGVIVFDGSRVRVAAEARRTRLPASYGSWIVNEWVVAGVSQRPTWI